MRFLIFLALCVLCYFMIRKFFSSRGRTGNGAGRQAGMGRAARGPFRRPPPPVQDELMQDPVCGVYCPKREALPLIQGGKTYYFCSEECRRKFQDRAHKD